MERAGHAVRVGFVSAKLHYVRRNSFEIVLEKKNLIKLSLSVNFDPTELITPAAYSFLFRDLEWKTLIAFLESYQFHFDHASKN